MIYVNGLGVKFKMKKFRRSRMLTFILDGGRRTQRQGGEFWALRGVSFAVECGETIGIIGANGSGKSTLLRVIAGIYSPDEGEALVKGNVTTLFTLGAGFQPELTGRDNIYLDGITMGLRKKEIDGIINEVIDFAELGDFIDMPVRTYSSGMHSRLGFAITIHIDRDIVLIDEIMSAGDTSFRQKASTAMDRIINDKTVMIVSHDMDIIRRFADRVIWLDRGGIVEMGDTDEIIRKYLAASMVEEPFLE